MNWRLGLLIALLAGGGLLASAQENSCPVVVQTALDQMGSNCNSLERNSACYGFVQVNSSFFTEQPADFFVSPADQAQLAQLQSLSTSPLGLSLAEWGIAVMSVQANIPATLPGQAVTFLLMGDTEVRNDITNVQLQVDTRLLLQPTRSSAALTTVAGGTSLAVDEISADGLWLRVISDAGPGWIRREAVAAGTDLSRVEAGIMQAFRVRTAFNELDCSEAPSLLAVQSPENIMVDLHINGVQIRMGTTAVLRTLPPGDLIQIMNIEGNVILHPDTPEEVPLPVEFSATHCLDAEDFIGPDCAWTDPVPLTAEELLWAETVRRAFAALTAPTLTQGCAAGSTIQHTVEAGDTLSGLSQRYETTINAIVAHNNLSGPTIFVGQVLTIVCGEQAFPSLPPNFYGTPTPTFVNPNAPTVTPTSTLFDPDKPNPNDTSTPTQRVEPTPTLFEPATPEPTEIGFAWGTVNALSTEAVAQRVILTPTFLDPDTPPANTHPTVSPTMTP